MIDLYRMLGSFIDTQPPTDPDARTAPLPVACMNQDRECPACIFHTGHLARWCPPPERAAKAQYDATRNESAMEVAA